MAQTDGSPYWHPATVALYTLLLLSAASEAASAPSRSLALPSNSTKQSSTAGMGEQYLGHAVQPISILLSQPMPTLDLVSAKTHSYIKSCCAGSPPPAGAGSSAAHAHAPPQPATSPPMPIRPASAHHVAPKRAPQQPALQSQSPPSPSAAPNSPAAPKSPLPSPPAAVPHTTQKPMLNSVPSQ